MPYLPSNRALLDRFRAGEPAALEEVYMHYAPGLARILRAGFADGSGRFSGGGMPLELADAMQETFARVFSDQSRRAYDGLSPFGAWLTGVAHNLAVDHFRKRRTSEAVLQSLASPGGMAEASTGPAPDVAAEENEAARLLATFHASLEAGERLLFEARYEARLTQEETAASLGLTRIQVRRAELKLRLRLLDHFKRNGFLREVRITGWGLDRLPTAVPRKRSDT